MSIEGGSEKSKEQNALSSAEVLGVVAGENAKRFVETSFDDYTEEDKKFAYIPLTDALQDIMRSKEMDPAVKDEAHKLLWEKIQKIKGEPE